jgi:hypothetical protein
MDEAMISMIAVGVLLPLAIMAVVFWLVLMPMRRRSAEAQAIFATGEPGQARVLAITATGTSLNDNPEVRMQLEVYLAGRAPYRTEYTTIVSLLAIPRVQPGCVLALYVDRANPMRVAVAGL